MINKDVRKSLARKKVNDILIWSWNNSDDKIIELVKFSLPHKFHK